MTTKENTKKLTESQISFYEEHICSEADTVFRFCLSLVLNPEKAKELLTKVYEKAVSKIHSLLRLDQMQIKQLLLTYAYEAFANFKEEKSPSSGSPVVNFLKHLSFDERTVFVLVDIFGLHLPEAGMVLSEKNEDALMERLIKARKALVEKFKAN